MFENKGKRYCVWAEKVNIGKKISNLYIAEMKSPTELATAQVLLSSPDYEWERVGFWVNEGPAVIKHNGKIFLTYSASDTVKKILEEEMANAVQLSVPMLAEAGSGKSWYQAKG